MRPTLTHRVYLAAPAAAPASTRLLARQVIVSAAAGRRDAPVTNLAASPIAALTRTDHCAVLVLAILSELMERLFGVDLLTLALL